MSDQCRSCGAAVLWVMSAKTSKRIPLNAEPDPERGNTRVLDVLNGERQAVVLGGEVASQRRAAGEPLYLSHFVTCPDAQARRKQ